MKRIGLKAGIGGVLGIAGVALCCSLPTLGIAAAAGVGLGTGLWTESIVIGLLIAILVLVGFLLLKRRKRSKATPEEFGSAITCDPTVFTKEERDQHAKLAENVLLRWPYQREERENGYLFRYRGDTVSLRVIASWVEGEHRCCPWGSFALEVSPTEEGSPSDLLLYWKGGPEGKVFLKEALADLEKGGKEGFEVFLSGREKIRPRRASKPSCGCSKFLRNRSSILS